MNQDELISINLYQREYFEILEEFFINVTGKKARNFARLDGFHEAIKKLSDKLKACPKRLEQFENGFYTLESKLKKLYADDGSKIFRIAKKIDGCKLNLGGSSRFLGTHLNATRRSLLYADTVLIPDPVLPWIEVDRKHEIYKHITPIQMAFFVLHLNDLLGDETDYPAFIIFPSWEKILEEKDVQTKENTSQLITDVFSFYIDSGINCFEDIIDYSNKSPETFLEKIDKAKLFISPGGSADESLSNALKNYKEEMQTTRTQVWCEHVLSQSDSWVAINAISERIQPQYHLLENSDEMKSHPFLCIEAHAHYYQLIANMKNTNIFNTTGSDSSTTATLNSLTSTRLDFLANISDSQLSQFRKTKENVKFRRDMRDLVNSLPTTKIEDLAYVSAEVSSHIESIIATHEKQMKNIQERYNAKHKNTLLLGVGTLGVTLFPVLAPFVGAILPLGLATTTGKYVSEKMDEIAEKNIESRSMMGVMALAKYNQS